jgi:two-component system OmpR family sensor kinase
LLVLKNKDINLLNSENKTLRSFFILYTLFSVIIIIFSWIIYYYTQRDLLYEKQSSKLKFYSAKILKDLEYIHNNFKAHEIYPRYKEFNSAIYDSDEKLIFTTLNQPVVNFNKNIYEVGDKIHYIRLLNSYYLGAMYLVIEVDSSSILVSLTQSRFVIFAIILFIILVFGGYFLLKLLLKPMRESLHLLDRFIKDTTHELNTPVSSILANIELMDESIMDSKNLKKLKRIDIASKVISNIYNDLTFIALGNRVSTKNEQIDISILLKQRVDFFQSLLNIKGISYTLDLQTSHLFIDQNKITRVIDNLISNAIKYNKQGGNIDFISRENSFKVIDSGLGIEKYNLDKIFNRYSRFNDSEGGFGMGLSIVYSIVQEYNMHIDISSIVGSGTEVTITW